MTALRRSRLRAKSAKKAREDRAKGPIRLQVFERDGGCRFAILGYSPCFGPLEACHIVKDGQGGEFTPANLFAGCSHHNSLCESDADFAALARSIGLVKWSWER